MYFKLLSNAPQQETPLEECFSEATRLNQQRLVGLGAVIWSAKKKSSVKATILSLAIKSASWTIEPRKRDLKILSQIRQGFTWNGQQTEVHCNYSFVSLSFKMQSFEMLACVGFLDFAGKNFVLGWKLPMKAAGETARRIGSNIRSWVFFFPWLISTQHRSRPDYFS